MGIEAYLDVEEEQPEETKELEELSPEAYKGLVQQINIDKAEQSIIEEVVGVDGDDDENEEEELREEREMKNLFEQLYEIDPDTKEVFVKGSAYDLKKWDEDMVCFTFGDPERVIALEAAISPGERYLSRCFDKLSMKHTQLAEVMRRHSNALRAKTISKAFAQDFKQVMGYPLPNIHMESFTTLPSATNYNIAMEEMNNQQIAIAAGASLAGVAIVYKLVQWFAKALNKNSLATSSISENFKAYSDRKEMLKNLPNDLSKLQGNVDAAVKEYMQANDDNPAQNINKAIASLKQKFSSNDASGAFDEATKMMMQKSLKGKYTPFMQQVLSGKLNQYWWSFLNKAIIGAKESQDRIMAQLEDMDKQYTLDKTKESTQVRGGYDWVKESLYKMQFETFTRANGESSSQTQMPPVENWSEVASWFNAMTSDIFTPFQDDRELPTGEWAFVSLQSIDLKIFENLDSGHVDKMKQVAERIKKHAEDAAKKGREASKENKIEKGDRAKALMDLSKEFQFVSSILRFAIQVRNQLGQLSVRLTDASAKSEGMLKKMGMVFAAASRVPGNMVNKVKEGLNAPAT